MYVCAPRGPLTERSAEQGALLGSKALAPEMVQAWGFGAPEVPGLCGAGRFQMENQQPHSPREGEEGCQTRGARGSATRPPLRPPAGFLPTPGGALGAEGQPTPRAPTSRQPERSPPPRGGRGECRPLGAPAPAPPGCLEPAGEAAARVGSPRRHLERLQGPSQETAPRKKLGRGILGETWGIFPEVEGTPTHF